MYSHNHYLLSLALTRGLGPVTIKNLIAYCGGIEAVFEASKSKLLKTPGVGDQTLKLLRSKQELSRAEQEIKYCQRHGIEILSYLDPDFPQLLSFIHDAPLILFKKGPLNLNAQPALAIVGTRRVSPYGRELAEIFAQKFAQQDINVVSGLAYGVDIVSHKAVLKAGGRTTAVLAHGLDTLYPSNHRKKAKEIEETGALLTEYLTGAKPDAPHFPARNRIISGISRAVVVIEAGEKGGALITARYAFDQNREVFAIPGRVGDEFSKGCNKLIRQDVAKLVDRPEQVLEELDIQWEHHQQHPQLQLGLQLDTTHYSAPELKVLNALADGALHVDKISEMTGITHAGLSQHLLSLEFKDAIQQSPGKKFHRKL
ncbi:MAG: DNA-processing protein DprA [Bacteroidota bacterium]